MAAPSDASTSAHIKRAIFEPGPILIALATIAGAVFMSPVLVVPGAAAWVIAVMVTAGRRAQRERDAAADLSALPPSIQSDLQGVNAALDALAAAVARVPDDQRVMFAGIEQEARDVRDAVLRMARAAGALHRHLVTTRVDDLQERLEAHRQGLAATTDPATRASLEAEIARAEEGLARRNDMLATLERYRAALRELQGSAQDLADRAVNLSAGGELARHDEFDEQSPIRKITELRASVAALEEVLGAQEPQGN